MGRSSRRVSCLGWVCTRVLETAPPELCTKRDTAASVTSLNSSVVCIWVLWWGWALSQTRLQQGRQMLLLHEQSVALRVDVSTILQPPPLSLSAAFSLPGEHRVYNCKWANIRSLNSKIWAGGLVIRFELNVLTAKGRCWSFGLFCMGGRWWGQGGSFSVSPCCLYYSLLPPFNSSNSLISMIKQSLAGGWWDVTLCSFGQRPQPSLGQEKLPVTGRGAPDLPPGLARGAALRKPADWYHTRELRGCGGCWKGGAPHPQALGLCSGGWWGSQPTQGQRGNSIRKRLLASAGGWAAVGVAQL